MPIPLPPPALPIFRSPEQAELLTRLYLRPDVAFEFNELASVGARSTVDRELRRLAKSGLVAVDRVGRTRLFRAPADSPLFEPLRQLLERAMGVEAQLRDRLSAQAGVDAAAIFGSWAEASAGPTSDIDVLVIGQVAHDHVEDATKDVERTAGRDINLVVFPAAELRRRLDEGSGFLQKILDGPLIDLVGDVRATARLDHAEDR